MGILRGSGLGLALLVATTTPPGNGADAVQHESAPVSLAVPGRSNMYPFAAARGPFVVVAWAATAADGPTDVYAAVSRDAGRHFGSPVRVNETPGNARVSAEQPPRVALVPRAGRDTEIVIVWTAKGPQGSRLLYHAVG